MGDCEACNDRGTGTEAARRESSNWVDPALLFLVVRTLWAISGSSNTKCK